MIIATVFVVPLVFFVFVSYFFNRNKLDEPLSSMLVISFFEGLFAYLLTLIIAFEGFFNSFIWLIVLLLSFLLCGLVVFHLHKSLDQHWDLQVETIKNSMTVYFMTIAPFMVGLAIFRFFPVGRQLIFATLFTAGIFLLSSLVKAFITPLYQSLFEKLSRESIKVYIGLWMLALLLVFSWIFISVPYDTLSRPINLSDNTGYLNIGGFDSTMQNSLYSNEEIQVSLSELPYSEYEMVDYIHDGDYLYLIREDGRLFVIDTDHGIIRYNTVLTNQSVSDKFKKGETFFTAEDSVYALLEDGIYRVSTSSSETVESGSFEDATLLNTPEGWRILKEESGGTYLLLSVEDGIPETQRTFDDLSSDQSLIVISGDIFINDGSYYEKMDDPSMRFETRQGIPSFFADNDTMLFVETGYTPEASVYGSRYLTLDADGNEKIVSFNRRFNRHGLFSGGTLYLLPETNEPLGRIEAMKEPIDFEGIHRHYESKRFWSPDGFKDSYIVAYKDEGNQLKYLQIDHKDDEALLTLTSVENKDLAMPLPFYSHYGLGIFFPIFLAMFLPISNYREHITIIDFKSIINRK